MAGLLARRLRTQRAYRPCVLLLKMLPFSSQKLTTLPGHKGFFVVISSGEVRNQPLRKPSVKEKLAARPIPGSKPIRKNHDREAR